MKVYLVRHGQSLGNEDGDLKPEEHLATMQEFIAYEKREGK